MTRRLISVIAPAYNEEDCVDELVRRLTAVFDSNDNYDFEAVIVENGSTAASRSCVSLGTSAWMAASRRDWNTSRGTPPSS